MKMNRYFLLAVIIAVVFCFSTNISAQEYSWKIGYNTGEGSVRDVAAKEFKAIVEEKTDGKVEISLYPLEALGSEQEMLEAIQFGGLDFQLAGGGAGMARLIPKYAALGMPFLFENYEEAEALLNSQIGEELNDLGKEYGIKVLSRMHMGFAQITNNKHPINSIEDFKGIRMRSPEEPTRVATFELLGSSVSTLPYSELYMGLSQGVVDGQFNPISAIYNAKFYEVQDYLAIVNIFYYHVCFMMNHDLWEGLDEEMQDIIWEASLSAGKKGNEFTLQEEKRLADEMKEYFKEVTYPDVAPFRNAVQPVYGQVSEEVRETIEEIQDFLTEYRNK